jgi:hypothetical protein
MHEPDKHDMTFKNIADEVAEEFAEPQARFEHAVIASFYRAPDGSKIRDGITLLRGNAPRQRPPQAKPPARRAYLAAHAVKRDMARIRAALLRGERPGKRGLPPTRWIACAKELGIDLNGGASA